MNNTLEMLKKPRLWSIVVPAVFFLWAISSTANMLNYRQKAKSRLEITNNVKSKARHIESILKRAGRGNKSGTSLNLDFDTVASSHQCAQAAAIPVALLSQGGSSKPKLLKDGSLRHNENFNLTSVRLIQIAKFIDFAERNYSSLRCTKVTIKPIRGKKRDAWDATISFQYLKKASLLSGT